MAKEELIEMNGAVTEVLPDSRYRVPLDNGHQLIIPPGRAVVLAPRRARARHPSRRELPAAQALEQHREAGQAVVCSLLPDLGG